MSLITRVFGAKAPLYNGQPWGSGRICISSINQIEDYSTDLNQYEIFLCKNGDNENYFINPSSISIGNWAGVSWNSGVFLSNSKCTMAKIYLNDDPSYTTLNISHPSIIGPGENTTYIYSADDSTAIATGQIPGFPGILSINVSAYKGGYIWFLSGRTQAQTYTLTFSLS